MPDRFLRRPRPTHHVAVEEAGDRGIPSKQTSTIPWTSRQKGRNEMDLESDGERPEAFRSVDADLEAIYGKGNTDKARDADANKDAGSHDGADAMEDANGGCEEGDAEEGDEADTSSSDEGDEDKDGGEEDEGNEADTSDDAKGDADEDVNNEEDATASMDAVTDNEGDADCEGEDEEETTGATDESLAAEEQAGRREETECKESAATDNSDIANASKVLDFLA